MHFTGRLGVTSLALAALFLGVGGGGCPGVRGHRASGRRDDRDLEDRVSPQWAGDVGLSASPDGGGWDASYEFKPNAWTTWTSG